MPLRLLERLPPAHYGPRPAPLASPRLMSGSYARASPELTSLRKKRATPPDLSPPLAFNLSSPRSIRPRGFARHGGPDGIAGFASPAVAGRIRRGGADVRAGRTGRPDPSPGLLRNGPPDTRVRSRTAHACSPKVELTFGTRTCLAREARILDARPQAGRKARVGAVRLNRHRLDIGTQPSTASAARLRASFGCASIGPKVGSTFRNNPMLQQKVRASSSRPTGRAMVSARNLAGELGRGFRCVASASERVG